MKTAAFHTLGCKVNTYETEVMRQALIRDGWEIRSFEEEADVYVINTCSVTNIADRKSRQMLHRAKKRNPDSVVVAAGCYAQAAADVLKDDESVDVIIGNSEKKDIAEILREFLSLRDAARESGAGAEAGLSTGAESGAGAETGRNAGDMPVFERVGDIGCVRSYSEAPAGTISDHTRAFLKVQDGCNQFCSYCIIPYVRGRVRSRAAEDVRREAERFAAQGLKELVLTGIHISSYGKDLPEDEPVRDLVRLTELLDGVEGISRVRLGSLEPRIITPEAVERLGALKSFCPHFHLSLQSGSESVLKRMNRHYTPEEYLEGVREIRRVFPDAAITTDIITGFPGETEKEFDETVAFVEEVRFYETHIFPYSVRKGTRAAAMPGQLANAVKEERAGVLAEIDRAAKRLFRERRIGRTEEILTEEREEIGGTVYMTGNTREYVRIAVPDAERNTLVRGRVTGFLTPDVLIMEKADT